MFDKLLDFRTASEKQIRRAYRQLVLKYHPDKAEGPEAEKMFFDIVEVGSPSG